MTKDEVEKTLKTGYFEPDKGDWYEILIWSLYVVLGLYFVTFEILRNLGISPAWTAGYVIPIGLPLVIYSYRNDKKIRTVRTGLSEGENLKLLKRVIWILNWPVKQSSNLIEITDDSFVFKYFVRARFIYTDDVIGYAFQYHSTWRGGRPTFYFGIRRYLRHRFRKMLDSFIG